MRHSVYVYAPVEGRVDEAALDGEEQAVARYEYRGREVAALTVELKPGQERVIEYELFTGPEQSGQARLLTTPAALGTGVGTVADTAC
jgi:hypothetical protein